MKKLKLLAGGFSLLMLIQPQGLLAANKRNILVIWGDDIGPYNPSIYNQGRRGYKTPNIDRIAKESVLFTDAYGDQSCTAGRSSFITGQHPMRTGLTKVGLPGACQTGVPGAASSRFGSLARSLGHVAHAQTVQFAHGPV